MIISEEIIIKAPLSVVWNVFERMEDWQEWNTVTANCCIIEGEKMAAGTCFSFEMKPYFFPIKVVPRIVKCEPGREVVWEGRRFGIHAVHRFTFTEDGDTVRLLSVEKFQGLLVGLARLLMVPGRLHHLTRKMMQSIKVTAEACAA